MALQIGVEEGLNPSLDAVGVKRILKRKNVIAPRKEAVFVSLIGRAIIVTICKAVTDGGRPNLRGL